ncbi:hypothetical protein [Streptomyces sp. NPDC059828]|uniref:hypothetical protein n=1 Tax=Streptomyces sp. NPDC059828 TaxID=3346965 RepID=UPI00364D6733
MERDAWVQALAPSVRSFSERRARELGVLEAVQSGEFAAGGAIGMIEGWTDWLQLRVASAAQDADLLRSLADHGRTKRIRHTAREALR